MIGSDILMHKGTFNPIVNFTKNLRRNFKKSCHAIILIKAHIHILEVKTQKGLDITISVLLAFRMGKFPSC